MINSEKPGHSNPETNPKNENNSNIPGDSRKIDPNSERKKKKIITAALIGAGAIIAITGGLFAFKENEKNQKMNELLNQSQITESTQETSPKDAEAKNGGSKNAEVTTFSLTAPIDLVQYRAEYDSYLSSTDKVKELFYNNSPECDKVGSYCLEQALSNGNLYSLYGKNWEYKYVNINSPKEDIIDNMNIKYAAAMASVDGNGNSDPSRGLAVLYYIYDPETIDAKNGEKSMTITNSEETILKLKSPTEVVDPEAPISSSEVFKCQNAEGKITYAKVIQVQVGSSISKEVFVERTITNFKGETITDIKLADEVEANLSDEAAISSVKLTIIK